MDITYVNSASLLKLCAEKMNRPPIRARRVKAGPTAPQKAVWVKECSRKSKLVVMLGLECLPNISGLISVVSKSSEIATCCYDVMTAVICST